MAEVGECSSSLVRTLSVALSPTTRQSRANEVYPQGDTPNISPPATNLGSNCGVTCTIGAAVYASSATRRHAQNPALRRVEQSPPQQRDTPCEAYED